MIDEVLTDETARRQAKHLVRADHQQSVFDVGGNQGPSRRFAVRRLVGHNPPVYHLRDVDIKERSRFGSRADIMLDVAYVLQFGTLPPAKGGRW